MVIPPGHKSLPLRKVNEACGLKGNALCTTMGAEALKTELDPLVRDLKIVTGFSDGSRSNLKRLHETIVDDQSSFPSVTLAPEYFRDPACPYKTRGSTDSFYHSLTAIAVSEGEIVLFDPLAKRIRGDSNAGASVVVLPEARFLSLWENDLFPNEMLWFQPKDGDILAY